MLIEDTRRKAYLGQMYLTRKDSPAQLDLENGSTVQELMAETADKKYKYAFVLPICHNWDNLSSKEDEVTL